MKLLTAPVQEVPTGEDKHDNVWEDLNSPLAFGDMKLKPFQRFAKKVLARENGKQDVVVPFADIKFVEDMGAIDVRNVGRILMTDLAFSQLCMRLKVPADYMLRCPLNLRNAHMAYWVDQNDERKVMLRLRMFNEDEQDAEGIGVLRAVLPQTYEPIDNRRILDWIGTAVSHFDGALGIQHFKVGEISTHVRLVFDKGFTVGDEEFAYGVHVSDSEVGERSFSADLVSLRKEHEIGILHLVEGAHLVTQRHIHIDFKLLRRNFAECFDAAKENRELLVDLFSAAADTDVKDPHSYLRRLVRHYRLTNDFAETAIHAYEAEPKPNRFGIALAFSRASKRMPIDMRVDTEAIAGAYIMEGA